MHIHRRRKRFQSQTRPHYILDERTDQTPSMKKEFLQWERPVISDFVQERGKTLEVNEEPSTTNPTEVETYPNNWEFVRPEVEMDEAGSGTVEVSEDDQKESRIPRLYPIGQMHGTYIFAQNENGLYIIDQHAAQERLKYEYFREKVGRVHAELQELLVPITLDYSTDEYLKINENLIELEKVGVFLEDFGMNSYIVRSHPQWFPKGDEKQIIEDMIEQLLSMKKSRY